MLSRLTSLMMIIGLSACAVVPDSAEEAAMRERREKPAVHANLVEAMLAQGQNHAALAHIEELERKGDTDNDQLRYLRAKAEYRLGDFNAAERHFNALLSSRFQGQAWHGLGLIAARSNLRLAVQRLNQAVRLRPTDASIRNDLGYTLMQAGRLTEARHHLATATQLDASASQAQSNLVLSFLVDDDVNQARAMAASFQLKPEQWRQLQAESSIMRRLISERSQELMAEPEALPQTEIKQYEEHNQDSESGNLPGLYRSRR